VTGSGILDRDSTVPDHCQGTRCSLHFLHMVDLHATKIRTCVCFCANNRELFTSRTKFCSEGVKLWPLSGVSPQILGNNNYNNNDSYSTIVL